MTHGLTTGIGSGTGTAEMYRLIIQRTSNDNETWEVNGAGSTCPRAPATRASHSVLLHSPTVVTMSRASPEVRRHANYQTIFDSALKAYRNKTGKDLSSNPLFHKLETCRSPDDIITVLRQQIPALDQSASSRTDEDLKLTRWLGPTVKVVDAFSVAIRGTIGPVSRTAY